MKNLVFTLSLFIIAVLKPQINGSFGESDCHLVINEFNTGSPNAVKNNEFIELKQNCGDERKIVSLQGYKVIGISAGVGVGTNNKQEMTIDLIINLWNEKMKSDFFTIGAQNVQNIDLSVSSSFVTFRNKYTGNTKSMRSFFTKTNTFLYAIAIIYKKSFTFPELVLTDKKPFININNEILELIKTNLLDMVVYGQKAPFETCDLFTNLCNDFANKEYVLREFDNKKTDRTLNRCTFDSTPFVPEKFKIGAPSPGKDNDCTGAQFFFGALSK